MIKNQNLPNFNESHEHNHSHNNVHPQDRSEKDAQTTSTQGKDKWIAFILCLFCGMLGMHKFYEEKVHLGILYILTCGLFGIGVIRDLIIIVAKKERYYTISQKSNDS